MSLVDYITSRKNEELGGVLVMKRKFSLLPVDHLDVCSDTDFAGYFILTKSHCYDFSNFRQGFCYDHMTSPTLQICFCSFVNEISFQLRS